MDEPTSGLDSATARALMAHLTAVSRHEGRTVVATVHQPAWAIVELFESVVLLARGSVCYRGPPAGVPEYFSAHNAPCPDAENPADHMLYVLSADGDVRRLLASGFARRGGVKPGPGVLGARREPDSSFRISISALNAV